MGFGQGASHLVAAGVLASRWGSRWALGVLLCSTLILLTGKHVAAGNEPSAIVPVPTPPAPAAVEERFQRLESLVDQQAEQIRQLIEANRVLTEMVRSRSAPPLDPRVNPTQGGSATPPPGLPPPPSSTLPLEGAGPVPPASDEGPPPDAGESAPAYASDAGGATAGTEPAASEFSYLMDGGNDALPQPGTAGRQSFLTGLYDQGYVLVAPNDKQRAPFALKVNLTSQLRYSGFVRSTETWTDSSGRVIPVLQRSNFALNRNWFTFSGYAFSPKLQFFAMVFSTSTTNQTIAMGATKYAFSKGLTLSSGYYKVPGTREWLESARYTLGTDRSMANTFFRPSLSPGVWIDGEPLENVYYLAGVFNNFNAAALGTNRVNNNMTYSANLWWEPLGEFGPGYSDQEFHEDPVIRTGSSLTFQRSRREPDLALGQTNPEDTILRLSDGTPIYQRGALADGVTVTAANITLFSYDLALKYRGLSLSGEYYGRWLNGIDARGGLIPRPYLNLFDTGGLAQMSFAIIPKRLELYARTSGVYGTFGDGSEYGGGLNWYIYDKRNVRGTFEVKRINHSPANNALYGYFAGESGTLFQLQLLTDF